MIQSWVSSETPFERLEQCVILFRYSRTDAAISVWGTLPEDFRVKVLEFTVFCVQAGRLPTAEVVLDTPYGRMNLTRDFIQGLVSSIPAIASRFVQLAS